MDGTLRMAVPADARAVRRIYAPYVEETAVTFATSVPSTGTLERKLAATLEQYPWLVCERGRDRDTGSDHDSDRDTGSDPDSDRDTGSDPDSDRDSTVVGYAYAGPLRDPAAYRWTAELSVYVDRADRGAGVGRGLYTALVDLLAAQGYASVYGVVALPNPASVGLHEALGFEHVGTFDDAGYKFGDWHDVGWWRRRLPDPAAPDAPRPVDSLPAERVRRLLTP
jgi:phosphinothricin acetyltransferase